MADTLREKKLQKILELEQILIKIQDTDILLERLLTEAREIVHADAGSIYVCEKDKLRIKYAQNDTQQRKLEPGAKLPFVCFSFVIDEKSICGYSVKTSKIVNIPDAYSIPESMPYSFNIQSDQITGYRSKSILTLPLITSDGKVLGVLQMINAMDSNGNIIPFDKDAELFLVHFAASAAQALERTYLTRSMIMRMIRMAELRDPKETGMHVLRVSNYSVEIFDRWAVEHEIPLIEKEKFRDELKIASMLHDVGKVGISDLILKKEGSYTNEEFNTIKRHTFFGASLFTDINSSIDSMAKEVALHHHERWDGSGYPGKASQEDIEKCLSSDLNLNNPGLVGDEIPLAARIVAIADVFDALSSNRVYKKAWKEADVFAEIQAQAGKHFDPELVSVFFKIIDRIRAIQNSFED